MLQNWFFSVLMTRSNRKRLQIRPLNLSAYCVKPIIPGILAFSVNSAVDELRDAYGRTVADGGRCTGGMAVAWMGRRMDASTDART